MKPRAILFALLVVTAPLLNVFAEEPKPAEEMNEEKRIEIEAGVTGIYPSIQGNQAKYSEYGDIRNAVVGAYGTIYLDYTDPNGHFVKFNAVDIGYDDQYYRLDAGKRGHVKYFFFYNETPHNISYNAVTPYAGAGTDTLAYGGAGTPSANISTWHPFDYSTKRKEYGAGAKIDVLKPFYFDVSVSQEKKTGIKPYGAEGAAAFGRVIELPQPVDYRTDYVKAEAGYAKQPYFLSFHYTYSQFNNNSQFLYFRNPFLATQPNVDALTLPPDNYFHKGGVAGTVKLPYNSKFNMNLGYSMAKSEQTLLPTIWDGNALMQLTLNRNTFHGDVRTQVYDFVLTSNPFPFIEGKAYYKYFNKQNKSDMVAAIEAGTTTINNPLSYTKQSYGAELDFRLRKNLHLITGYKHVNIDRNRLDVPENQDDIYSAELRWNFFKMGLLKVGYERLIRTAQFQAIGATGDDAVQIWVRRYDVAPRETDTFKASFNLSPLDELSFNTGYKYRRTSYTTTILGLQRNEDQTFNFDADYGIGSFARFFGYFDYDYRKFTQFQRRFAAGGNPNPYGGVQNATNFNWQSDQTDKTYDFGLALDLYAVPKLLTVRLSAAYLQSHGTNDFTYFTNAALTGGRNNDNIDIPNWGCYKKEFYMIKFLYDVTASTSLTAGFAYEKYSVSDAQYDGYVYTLGNPPTTYLTGAYANPNYKANVVFLGVNYKFQ